MQRRLPFVIARVDVRSRFDEQVDNGRIRTPHRRM
jgi:hypothetical protein